MKIVEVLGWKSGTFFTLSLATELWTAGGTDRSVVKEIASMSPRLQ